MKEKVALVSYLAGVLIATSIHSIPALAVMLAVVLALAGRAAPRVAWRALRTVLLFSAVVTLSYVVVAAIDGRLSGRFVALLNLRVFLLACGTFLLTERINLFRAFSFSRTLSRILALAYGQILTFRRVLAEFGLALRSRSPKKPTARRILTHGGSTGAWFLRKSLHRSTEITAAMRSRGLFDD